MSVTTSISTQRFSHKPTQEEKKNLHFEVKTITVEQLYHHVINGGAFNNIYDIEGTFMYKGVTNIGIRPTINDGTYVTVETFVLDFDEDVYDSDVIIRLKKFIRPEQKFDSVNGLKKQLEADIAFVRG